MKASSALNKIVSWLGLFFFVLAAYMIYRQLSKYSMEELKNALLSIPLDNLLYALCASFTGYVALSTYDYLALKYIQRKLAAWKWILTGFVGFPSATMPVMPSFPAVRFATAFIPDGE